MPIIWLTTLILGAAFAVAGASGASRKLLNLLVIVGCMGLGFGIGYAAGLGSGNMGKVDGAGTPFALILGIVGAMGCVAENTRRARE